MYSNHLLYLPNYHSYIIRFENYFKRCNLTLYRLYNPFAGLISSYNLRRPVCYKWCCILPVRFRDDFYMMVYEMQHEKIRKDNIKNFNEIFNITDCNVRPVTNFLNLDMIPDKYTIYPLAVNKVKLAENLFFMTEYVSTNDLEELQLLVFNTDRTISLLHLNRNLRIQMKNPYVSSQFVDIKITKLFGVT